MSSVLYKVRRKSDGFFFAGSGYKKRMWTPDGTRAYGTEGKARGAIKSAAKASVLSHNCGPFTTDDVEIVEYLVSEHRTIEI